MKKTLQAGADVLEYAVDTAAEAIEIFEQHAPGQQIDGLPNGENTPANLIGESAMSDGRYVRVFANDGNGNKIWNEMF